MAKVLEDIRADTLALQNASFATNGASANGDNKDKDTTPKGRGERGQSLALPKNVVEEGVKITKESLDAVCEVVE